MKLGPAPREGAAAVVTEVRYASGYAPEPHSPLRPGDRVVLADREKHRRGPDDWLVRTLDEPPRWGHVGEQRLQVEGDQ